MAVEDLPQMWQQPSYDHLLVILASLALGPTVWSHRGRKGILDIQAQSPAGQRKSAETRYIASVIKSTLAWLATDDEREDVWAAAGRRMSERCGRMAVGDIVRRWPFVSAADTTTTTATTTMTALRHEPFELVIREPALTGTAGLGLKTWASAYVLAQQLPRLATSSSLFRLFDESLGQTPPAVLELGAGTGLLGLAAAALWRAPVTLSDLPAVVPNLQHNVAANRDVVKAAAANVRVGCLTWGGEEDAAQSDQELFGEPHQFPIVLAADSLYNDNHPVLLASAISRNLALGSEARALVMSPKRDGITLKLIEEFKQMMLDLEPPLFCEEEDEFVGDDDWATDDDDGDEEEGSGGNVRCWLGIFSRGGSPLTEEDD